MIPDRDIYRSASVLVKERGDGAMAEARTRLRKFRAAGNTEAAAAWVRIIEAIEALTALPNDSARKQ